MSSATPPHAASASPMPEGVTDPNYRPLPGRLGNLTVTQLHTLEKFKKELQDEGHFVPERMDDATLLRFLRARKFDLAKAKIMLISAEQWRKDEKVDEIAKGFDFPEKAAIDEFYPQYYHKCDKDGRPIYIESLAHLDIDKMNKTFGEERLREVLPRRFIYEYEKFLNERLPACSKAVGHPVETSCTILDLGGVALTSYPKVSKYVMDAASIGQNRYPECMGKFYIINAPSVFTWIWYGIKRFLDEVTVSKIAILSPTEYQEKLKEQIPVENLPVEYGGTCKCEGGCSSSDAGPWNPPTGKNALENGDAEGSK
ncbi:hypothetical protein PILCRDRAFT_823390 [Piloderma croceum F 1598]|uniref:CRAL-TRIO domain-containing protein n=1 Tax=Piloderma croceum (strain F 1598) TaxID=765440 RepID=A0A0C3FI88_PILCF|nr:hypothetical protein PILCRDRAFT_823390 [Piloderma croceum F 1598]